MKKRLFLFIAIIVCLLPLTVRPEEPAANGSDTEQMLWEHLMRRSDIWFDQVIAKKGGKADTGEWKEPIERALSKISTAAGCPPQGQLTYAVVNDGDFNAGCLAGGQVFICKGTLAVLDRFIERDRKANSSAEPQAVLRERFISPILAHEYGHFINKHQYREILRQWHSFKQDDGAMPQMKYSQDDELDADATGVILLKKAGYDVSLMEMTLKILNLIAQHEDQTFRDVPVITYTQTHPSPHARLAALKGKNAELHAWAASMERAFDDVQIGRNLKAADKILSDALAQYPSNAFFHRVYAAALHKSWLETVPIPAQELRSIISVPSFRDSMVFSDRGQTRGGKKTIPGNIRLYQAARSAYTRAEAVSADPELLSNYAVLLCYSPVREDEQKARQLADEAYTKKPSLSAASNMIVVLYLTGKRKAAYEYAYRLAEAVHGRYMDTQKKAEASAEDSEKAAALFRRISEIQNFDDTYMYADFTPILNYALICAYIEGASAAKPIAENLLINYDSSSAWARFLATTAKITIENPSPKKNAVIDGITVGSTMEALITGWGKPDEIGTDGQGNENWVYSAKKTIFQVENGTIMQITLFSDRSPSLNSIKVGSLRAEVETVLGKAKKSKPPFCLYDSLEQQVIIHYLNDTAIQIDIVP